MDSNFTSPAISEELSRQLSECNSLPTLPVVALKIIELAKDPTAKLGDISRIVSSDPALSVRLLKVVNSSMYSQRRAVTNIREALTLLGLNAAFSITLSFSIIDSLKENEKNNANLDHYWKRSILSGVTSKIIGSRMGLYNLEDLFLASLLQDVGVLVFEKINLSPYGQNKVNHADRIALENKNFGTDHSYIGAWLLELWGLPKKITNAIKYSHYLNNVYLSNEDDDYHFVSCVNLSGILADIWLEDTPTELVQTIKKAAQLMMDVDSDEFELVVSEINNELPKVSSLFDIDLNSEIERGQLLENAREISMERSIHVIKESESNKRYIKKIEKQVRSIEDEIHHDHLTKTFSRKYIENELVENFEYATTNSWPLSLAFIDVDGFKEINDSHGHVFGDTVLVSIADFFSNNVRQTDILARYGGDEFVLMLPGATVDAAEEMLNRLIKMMQGGKEALQVGSINLVPSVSIGIATHMDKIKFENLESFIQSADKALYDSKLAGKNRVSSYKHAFI